MLLGRSLLDSSHFLHEIPSFESEEEKMTSRAELMQQLLKLPTSVILQCLEDKTMLDIASRYFTSTCQSDQPSISPGFSPTPVGSHLKSKVKTSGKAKPASVNAFMAFRSESISRYAVKYKTDHHDLQAIMQIFGLSSNRRSHPAA